MAEKMTAIQQRVLKDRLNRINNEKPSKWDIQRQKEDIKPASVLRAEAAIEANKAIISAHEEKKTSTLDERMKKRAKLYHEAEQAIYFSSSETAIALIDQFESSEL